MTREPLEPIALRLLCEGMPLHKVGRCVGTSTARLIKRLQAVGKACKQHHQETITTLASSSVHIDCAWSYHSSETADQVSASSGQKERISICTWVATDVQTNLIVSYLVDRRDSRSAMRLIDDIAPRVRARVPITATGSRVRIGTFGNIRGTEVDQTQLSELYDQSATPITAHEPAEPALRLNPCILEFGTAAHDDSPESTALAKSDSPSKRDTSARLRLSNHTAMIALYATYHNFLAVDPTSSSTPAMASGISDIAYDFVWLDALVNDL